MAQKSIKETNDYSIASIQVELGHASEEQEKALKLYKKQLRKQEKRNAEIALLNNKLENNTLVPSIIPMDEPISEGDDPNVWSIDDGGEMVAEENPYVGPYRAGYKPVPLEIQIEKYDKIIKNDFEFDKEGKPIIYTEEEANFFNSLIKTRNSLALDYQYQQKIDDSPSNAEIIEMQNLRKDDGTLKNVPEEAFYVESFTASNGMKGGGYYVYFLDLFLLQKLLAAATLPKPHFFKAIAFFVGSPLASFIAPAIPANLHANETLRFPVPEVCLDPNFLPVSDV